MGNPYVKLLSLVDPNKASAEFHEVRGGVAATNITYNAANSTTGGQVSGGLTVSLTDDMVKTINSLGTYLPVLLAIMAANAVAVIAVVVGAAVYLCRRRSRGAARARKTPGRLGATMPMSTMPLNASQPSFSMASPGEAAYQPVSMALTDDPFVPPSPAFQKEGGAKPMRPMSVA